MKRKLMSCFLSIVMLLTFLPNMALASLLPLQEKKAYLVVGDHDGVDISAVPLSLLLDNLMDSNGNLIEVDKNAKVAWCYCKDRDGSTITDDYYIIDQDGTVDLSIYEEYDRYTLEIIIGDGNQLNPQNERYSVTVYLSDQVTGLVTYDLYRQDADGTRHKIVPIDQYVQSMTMLGVASTSRIFIVPDHVEGTEYYLGINDPIAEHPFVQCDVMDYADYLGFMMGEAYGYEYQYTDLSPQFINVDMTKPDAGYKNNWDMPEVTEESVDITKTFVLLHKDTYSGKVLSTDMVTIAVVKDMARFEDDAFIADEAETVKLATTLHVSVNEIKQPFDLTGEDITQIRRVFLKEGYSPDNEYCYALYAQSPIWSNANDHVLKATEGWFDTLESAEEAEDISDQLLPKSNSTAPFGYKANYNIANGGVRVSIFFDDGSSFRFLIVFQEYDKNADLNYMREYTDKPIIGERDPWLRVTGAKGIDDDRVYVIENGKAINMDTYYGYGYQTVLINDDVDLSALNPSFWYANTDRVYAVSKESGKRVEEDHVRDFTKGVQQYTGIIIDNGIENERNYWVTFKKVNNNGPELYVYGPSEREVILDEYFEFKHDILIANIGNALLEDISVELIDAENVKIDDYWTIGSPGNNTLAPFTTTSSGKLHGELANLAKIRLIPDGDGEVKGRLVINAKDQTPVTIDLNGTAQNPEIVTETLENAVKYVPYQSIIATNNIHDWNEVTFSLTDGELPDGVKLLPTGELYGVPIETGTTGKYTFKVKADYSNDSFNSSEKEFTLVVDPNTDKNVKEQIDEGFEIITPVGDVNDKSGDQVFEFKYDYAEHADEFQGVYIDGEKLVKGVDYDVEPGSTKITIKSQTISKQDNGKHTIAAEYRTKSTNKVKKSAQNYTKSSSGGSSSSSRSRGSSSAAKPSSYKVYFEVNGGAWLNEITVAAGTAATLPTPVRDGFIFGGWYTDAELTKPYDTNQKVNSAFALYAKWIELCKVWFITNGGNQVDALDVQSGNAVSELPVPVKEGYVFEGWYKDEELTQAYNNDPITESISLYAKWVEDKPVDKAVDFKDINATDWFLDDVDWAYDKKLMIGVSNLYFEPYTDITGGMVVAVLARMAEVDTDKYTDMTFEDVYEDQWYTPYAKWAKAEGLVNNIAFNPPKEITREWMGVILVRYLDYIGKKYDVNAEAIEFADASSISEVTADSLQTLYKLNILRGKGDDSIVIDPVSNTTRAEFAALIHRVSDLLDN